MNPRESAKATTGSPEEPQARQADNLILIGMPSAGKSTLGVLAAKALGMDFIDTDILLQTLAGHRLQEIMDSVGLTGFLEMEAAAVQTLAPARTVIATGGSVVYDEHAMRHLQRLGRVVYLSVPFAEIERRLGDAATRGIARQPGQSLWELYLERAPLYERYAEITLVIAPDTDMRAAVSRLVAVVRDV